VQNGKYGGRYLQPQVHHNGVATQPVPVWKSNSPAKCCISGCAVVVYVSRVGDDDVSKSFSGGGGVSSLAGQIYEITFRWRQRQIYEITFRWRQRQIALPHVCDCLIVFLDIPPLLQTLVGSVIFPRRPLCLLLQLRFRLLEVGPAVCHVW
jgi:hypothetical protein